MDSNPNHFPTLLFVCILTSIVLYVISNVVYVLHQRKRTKAARDKSNVDPELRPEPINNEEQEMVDYLKNQEDN